ncbi:hypothetical protein [Saccharopolyspora shandongensis]|uniref:hypothetical protein n=1 Tax=Saccharopolyspora shandongensis TaxID=418495 RepID=UPI0033D54FF0
MPEENETPFDNIRLQIKPGIDRDSTSEAVTFPYSSGLSVSLLEKTPEGLIPITVDRVAELNKNVKDLLQIAVSNTVKQELHDLSVYDHRLTADDRIRLVAKDDSPFVSSIMISIERLLPANIEFGALVSAPRYSTVLIYAVESDIALDVAVALDRLTRSMFAESTDALSAQLFWWHAGNYYPVGINTNTSGSPKLSLPPELSSVVNQLPQSGRRLGD